SGSRIGNRSKKGGDWAMRTIGLDVRREFCEVAFLRGRRRARWRPDPTKPEALRVLAEQPLPTDEEIAVGSSLRRLDLARWSRGACCRSVCAGRVGGSAQAFGSPPGPKFLEQPSLR